MTVSPPLAAWKNALTRAQRHSFFLRQQCDHFPDLLALLSAGDLIASLAAARRARAGTDISTGLRRERRAMSLVLAIADLAGAVTLEQVMASLSELADRSIEAALAAAIAE